MKKRLLCLGLIFVMAFSSAACGEQSDSGHIKFADVNGIWHWN